MPGRKPRRPMADSFDPSCCDRMEVFATAATVAPGTVTLPLERFIDSSCWRSYRRLPGPTALRRRIARANCETPRPTPHDSPHCPQCAGSIANGCSRLHCHVRSCGSICELSSVRPTEDRLPDRPLPDDESPSDPLGLGRKFRNDDELPSPPPRFMPPSDRLNDSPLLRLNERPPPSPPLMLMDGPL